MLPLLRKTTQRFAVYICFDSRQSAIEVIKCETMCHFGRCVLILFA